MQKITKVLFCSANPSDTARLRSDKEYREIDRSLRISNYRDQFELISSWATTTQDLLQITITAEPNLVHFSGHGTQSGIILENGIGNTVIVSQEGLGALFELFLGKVNRVILNSCYSENQAELINNFVPYVIGMSHNVPDATAIAFSSGFYKAIGAGKDIPTAFKIGIASVKLEGLPNSEIPVLLINANLLEKIENLSSSVELSHSSKIVQDNSTGKSMIAVDIDDFTVINSKFGRKVGEEIKKIIFEIISEYFQEIQISVAHNWIVPYSDEHYIAVAQSIAEARDMAEQIRERVSNYNWRLVSPELYVTVCCGIASYSYDETPEDTIIKALLGVKEAKAKAKNSLSIGPKYLPSGTNHLTKTVKYYVSGDYDYYVRYGGNEYSLGGSVTEDISQELRTIQNYYNQ